MTWLRVVWSAELFGIGVLLRKLFAGQESVPQGLKPLIYIRAKRPEAKASGYLEAKDCSSTVGLPRSNGDAFLEDVEGDVGLLLGDDERRAEADGVFAAAEQ